MTAYLNNKTTNQEFLDFVVDDVHNVVVSAVTQNGIPSAQVCDMLMNKNGKLYMTTSIKNLFYTAKDFDSFMIVPFEDRLYPIPSGYDNLLKTIYGDYMKYPPLAKQKLDKHFMKIKWR